MKILPLFFFIPVLFACNAIRPGSNAEFLYNDKGTTSLGLDDYEDTVRRVFQKLERVQTLQSFDASLVRNNMVYDDAINSPKSVIFSKDGKKFYVNSLEGYTTSVYDAQSWLKIKDITHEFKADNASLFKENEVTIFDYQYYQDRENYNHFLGKPVESCLSHNGRYLWVTYYRRDFDPNASSPSALAIIDTEMDEIVRVMPTGPLPKMIACSPDNKYIAVTQWGDNTVAIIDINADNVFDFHYVKLIEIDGKMNTANLGNVDRDNNCGNCLRGTVFTPDNRFCLVAKMGGNGVAVIRLSDFAYIGTVTGGKLNMRHLVIEDHLVFSTSNKFGYVQRFPLEVMDSLEAHLDGSDTFKFNDWRSTYVGIGARTIEITPDGQYLMACVNNESKVVVLDADKMEVIFTHEVDRFPVGLAISPDGNYVVVTSQGKDNYVPSGNAVNIFKIVYE